MIAKATLGGFLFQRRTGRGTVPRHQQSGGEMAIADVPVVGGTLAEVFADELYGRLPSSFTYVAENWEDELLKPHGYRRSDQSRVAEALHLLVKQGRITRDTVYPASGYGARRRSMCEKPRRVTVTKVS